MKVCIRVILLCCLALTVVACSKPAKEIKAGRYGMMSDETPQYAALVFIMAIYEEESLDEALKYASPKLSRLMKSYHTNSGVQRHLLNLRLDEMVVEPVSGGFQGITEFKKEASVDVKISGTYNNKRIIDLKTISMVKISGDWKITGIKNTIP
ncbi:hypothetical protein ISG33_05060 [Glaciecola sp. MH2013]|uniref:hypothetical protein n=1 Tax=Glaciecola sp. MH2013 TaxID=2785524 RepID=UPI00189D3880|nr:hypothetical protein [Glaciecola sp. MH2013]MBF7072769.1 hypothetical protein [Glaciecola sp. MH2013]